MHPIPNHPDRPRRASASNWQPDPDFDLDAAMAALPTPTRTPRAASRQGAAGRKLQAEHVSTIPAGLLEDFARTVLGAQRLNANYLAALRIVLGNQAQADRDGVLVELNHDVPFASARTMRTIIDQMKAAGITTGKAVSLGQGKRQDIQCFQGERQERQRWPDPASELEWRYRLHEGESDGVDQPPRIEPEDVPSWAAGSLTTQ